jgi:hypothetical protein
MSDVRDPATDQPLPSGGVTEVQQALINAIAARRELGIRKYGQPVMTHNGRNPLRDAWEEVIDLAVYLTQMMLEAGEELERPEVPATWKTNIEAAMNYAGNVTRDPRGLGGQGSVFASGTVAYGGGGGCEGVSGGAAGGGGNHVVTHDNHKVNEVCNPACSGWGH